MAVDHTHVRSIAVEPNELFGPFTETSVIVTGHAHVRFEPREAADSACDTFWNERHLEITSRTIRNRGRAVERVRRSGAHAPHAIASKTGANIQ
jgi:hypothetical protein